MKKWTAISFLILLLNSAYLLAFPSATLFYVANALLHVGLGAVLVLAFWWLLHKDPEMARRVWVARGFMLLATLLGVYLAVFGATRDHNWVLWIHIGAAVVGSAALLVYVSSRWPRFHRPFAIVLTTLILVPLAAFSYRNAFPDKADRIHNPLTAPLAMTGEGGGPKSPFWPSSSRTNVGGIIPSNFFMDSKACGECHKDIYEQWKGSMHHFASFNNQFYRKSIEHMQSINGASGSKWCAGCHDHAVFFNGRFDKPIKDQIDTPEAQNGLGCMSCHSIVHVGSSMGNGDFTMEYPPLHELAASANPLIHALDHYVTYLNPEPHRRTFLKPFMKHSSEFCSACHKVHLDVPVNNYRWLRGFNDYDNWQASGISGEGARSFYYPPKSMVCSDCHMPLVKSGDPGNHDGMVHSHRFPAANTAVAFVNRDEAQLKAEMDFLKSGFITVDLFAATPVEQNAKQVEMRRRSNDALQLSSTFAVGEEAEQSGQVFMREVGKVAAPIDQANARFAPGATVRLDAVVRTRKIGHFFPGGTVDAFDIWLEMEARDAAGHVVFWNGQTRKDGPVDKSAHFYKSYQLDGDGNPINKRNAWQARSVLYVRLIPPGAADVAHYLLKIPKDATGPISVTAKLNYRKFSRYFTEYAYAGQPKPGQAAALVGLDHDSREYTFEKTNIPKNVSGQIKDSIPELPIVTLATARTKLILNDGKDQTAWLPVVRVKDRERWNDWGIGLLLQGDLKGAEYAFRKVTEAEPGYADGWLNVARALIQEGETQAARPFVDKALQLNPRLGRSYFFKAMVLKADGDYDGALDALRTTQALFPHDRVVANQIGRILFLKRDYQGAVKALDSALSVDPEDLQAHYTLMLCYRGLGDAASAKREETLFRRFKADESAQSITAKARMSSAEDNNERQLIHDHESSYIP